MNTFIFLHQVVGLFGELKCIYPLVPSLSSSRHWRMKFNTGFYRCYFWLQQCRFGMKRGPVRRTPNPTCCLNCRSHHEGYSAIRIRPRHLKTLKSPTWVATIPVQSATHPAKRLGDTSPGTSILAGSFKFPTLAAADWSVGTRQSRFIVTCVWGCLGDSPKSCFDI